MPQPTVAFCLASKLCLQMHSKSDCSMVLRVKMCKNTNVWLRKSRQWLHAARFVGHKTCLFFVPQTLGLLACWLAGLLDYLRASLVACLPACLLACLFACVTACTLACLLLCLLASMFACLLACLRACLHVSRIAGLLAGWLAGLLAC